MPKSKARRARRNPTLPASLQCINLNAAGIDVGGESHFVSVPVDRDEEPVREFAFGLSGTIRRAGQFE